MIVVVVHFNAVLLLCVPGGCYVSRRLSLSCGHSIVEMAQLGKSWPQPVPDCRRTYHGFKP